MTQRSELSEIIADVKEHVLYMKELGVERVDAALPELIAEPVVDAAPVERFVPSEIPSIAKVMPTPPVVKSGSRIAALPSLNKRQATATPKPAAMPVTRKQESETYLTDEMKPALPTTVDTIESIRAEIGDCTRCPLHAMGRKQIVHTTGNFAADLMFVGEAPGADEDEQGFPFVGRAGQLLTKIIESIGLKREEVCIGNINRCRPPGNRQPVPEETAACRPFLLREIAVVQPKVIVVLGATAAQNLLQTKTPISKLRGNFQDYFGVKVMPTFHPAYLLRDPHKKKEVWEDMKKVRDYLNLV
ncbi:MAG TPA: uracil-DNA glycosylase [Pyrinomonadaceae bacterium]|nr:uracil-DNA glycosylase [Pyrinomonadaceae bacterium]